MRRTIITPQPGMLRLLAMSYGPKAIDCCPWNKRNKPGPIRLAKNVMIFPPKKPKRFFYYDLIDVEERLRSGRSPISHYGTKLYVMTPVTFTGCPDNSVGLKCEPRAADSAAALSNGWQPTAAADITLPVSRIVT